MTELQFLERQEAIATQRVERALLGAEGLEGAVDAIERNAIERPWISVGVATALGALVGATLGRTSASSLFRAVRLARGPLSRSLRKKI